MRRGFLVTLLVLATFALVAAQPARAQNAATPSPPPIYVTLWFDTEDYILTEDDDATMRLAEMLTRLGVRATFKIVGEKARVLEARKRTDVIAALQRHDIGYHSNTHSQQPTIAVYLQHAGWDDGRAEFLRREAQGARDVARIVGVKPVAYGQPGSAWAPQAYPALRDMGIGLYLDEADHVGIDDQPFFYGGLLNVFKMRSNLVRMNLNGGASLTEGEAAFKAAASRLATKGGGTISIYYHPNEWVQTEFWDAVNFSRGANPPRDRWKRPGIRPAAETEAAFRDFERFVRFMATEPGVHFVTATDLLAIYADRANTHAFTRDDVVAIARGVSREITFQRRDDYTISAADAFGLLTQVMAEYVDRGAWATTTRVVALDGPARAFTASVGGARSTTVAWPAFAQAVRDTAGYLKSARRVPDEIWIGAESLSPADFLATLAAVADTVGAGAKPPTSVERREGRFTADRLVADDTTALWGWPIFPEGFHAPDLMALARLQAWTLKPAIHHDAR